VLQALQSDSSLARVEIIYDKLGVGTLFFISTEGSKIPSYEYVPPQVVTSDPKGQKKNKVTSTSTGSGGQNSKSSEKDPKDPTTSTPPKKEKGPSRTVGMTVEEWINLSPQEKINHWLNSVKPEDIPTAWAQRLSRLDSVSDTLDALPGNLDRLATADDIRGVLSTYLNDAPDEAPKVFGLLFCAQRLVPPVRRAIFQTS